LQQSPNSASVPSTGRAPTRAPTMTVAMSPAPVQLAVSAVASSSNSRTRIPRKLTDASRNPPAVPQSPVASVIQGPGLSTRLVSACPENAQPQSSTLPTKKTPPPLKRPVADQLQVLQSALQELGVFARAFPLAVHSWTAPLERVTAEVHDLVDSVSKKVKSLARKKSNVPRRRKGESSEIAKPGLRAVSSKKKPTLPNPAIKADAAKVLRKRSAPPTRTDVKRSRVTTASDVANKFHSIASCFMTKPSPTSVRQSVTITHSRHHTVTAAPRKKPRLKS
jgi:hypothetical protein